MKVQHVHRKTRKLRQTREEVICDQRQKRMMSSGISRSVRVNSLKLRLRFEQTDSRTLHRHPRLTPSTFLPKYRLKIRHEWTACSLDVPLINPLFPRRCNRRLANVGSRIFKDLGSCRGMSRRSSAEPYEGSHE